MTDNIDLTPLSDDSHSECDCNAINRWRTYATALAISTTLLAIGCLMMGWVLSTDTPRHVHEDLRALEKRMGENATIVELKLDATEVLAEVRKINARLDRLEAKINN